MKSEFCILYNEAGRFFSINLLKINPTDLINPTVYILKFQDVISILKLSAVQNKNAQF